MRGNAPDPMIATGRSAGAEPARCRRACLTGGRVAVAAAAFGGLLASCALAAEPVAAPSAPLAAATSAAAAQRCDTPERCFARMAEAQRDVARIRARFRQTKTIALLDGPLESAGRFSFERPDRVRWEMETPEPLVVEVSGSELRAGPPGEVARVDAGPAVGLFRDLGGIFTGADGWAGSRFALGPSPRGGESFVLTPRDPSLTRVIAAIEIELDPASGGPRRVTITEAGGDRTAIELLDVEVERTGGRSP